MPLSKFSITLRRRSISASCPSSICRSLLSVVIIPNLFKPHVPTRGALGGSARRAAPRPRREKRLGLGLPRIGIELGDTLSKDAVHPRRRSWRFSGVRRKRSSANSVIRLNGKSCHRAAIAASTRSSSRPVRRPGSGSTRRDGEPAGREAKHLLARQDQHRSDSTKGDASRIEICGRERCRWPPAPRIFQRLSGST